MRRAMPLIYNISTQPGITCFAQKRRNMDALDATLLWLIRRRRRQDMTIFRGFRGHVVEHKARDNMPLPQSRHLNGFYHNTLKIGHSGRQE